MREPDQLAPDGIGDTHIRPARQRASWLALALTTAILLAACFGLLGGAPNPAQVGDGDDVRLTVTTPTTLRNGVFFETRVLIEPKRPIGELILAISPSLWRDITINSTTPEAEKETFEDGLIRMSLGSGRPGKPVAIKFDGQINPSLFGRIEGEFAVYDGEKRLVGLPVRIKVLP